VSGQLDRALDVRAGEGKGHLADLASSMCPRAFERMAAVTEEVSLRASWVFRQRDAVCADSHKTRKVRRPASPPITGGSICLIRKSYGALRTVTELAMLRKGVPHGGGSIGLRPIDSGCLRDTNDRDRIRDELDETD